MGEKLMQKRKDVLTTGQVAQICSVAPRTVTKWFDSGQLKGYRIPGSRDRRIPTSELVRFMKAHDIPTDNLDLGTLRVLIIDSDHQAAADLARTLANHSDYEVSIADNSFDAGLVAQKILPNAIIINLMSRDIDATQLRKYVRSNEDLSGARIIAVAANLNSSETFALQQKGFDAVITNPKDISEVVHNIEDTMAATYR